MVTEDYGSRLTATRRMTVFVQLLFLPEGGDKSFFPAGLNNTFPNAILTAVPPLPFAPRET